MSPEVTTLSILTSVRDSLVAEITSTRPPEPVVLRRDIAVLVTAALTEVMESLDALEQGCAATAQVLAALEEREAEVRRLRGREPGCFRVPVPGTGAGDSRRPAPPVMLSAAGNVVDLSAILGRERGASRQQPTPGTRMFPGSDSEDGSRQQPTPGTGGDAA